MATSAEVVGREAVLEEALSWPERAKAARITDAASYLSAAELLKGIKALKARIAETFDPHIKRAHDAHKALCKEKQDAEAPLSSAESIIKSGLLAFDREQEAIRREEQRRQEEAARRQAEADALARAAALEAEGKAWGDEALVQEAAQIVEEAIQAPAPVIAPVAKATPKVAGIAMRTDWTCECSDLFKLVQFIAAHPQHLHLVAFNQTAGNSLARALKENLQIPGVRAVPVQRVAAGR